MGINFYRIEKKLHMSITFFDNKRFSVAWLPFQKHEPVLCDLDCLNFFFEEKPFALFKLLKKARFWNKHYGHVRNRPIYRDEDYREK